MIRTVVTRGYGSGGSVGLVTTRGYSAGEPMPPVVPGRTVVFAPRPFGWLKKKHDNRKDIDIAVALLMLDD